MKLLKRLKKLIIKIPVSVLLLLIKKLMKYFMEERKLNGKYWSHWVINTSSGLRFDLKTLDASCDISWFSLWSPFAHIRVPRFSSFCEFLKFHDNVLGMFSEVIKHWNKTDMRSEYYCNCFRYFVIQEWYPQQHLNFW